VTTVKMTLISGRPSALLPAFDTAAPPTGAHAFVVGQASVRHQVSVQIQREERIKTQLWLQVATATSAANTAPTNNYKGTTSAKGAGMAKSLRNSGGVPPRGRPV
jgi:hypothetical protein